MLLGKNVSNGKGVEHRKYDLNTQVKWKLMEKCLQKWINQLMKPINNLVLEEWNLRRKRILNMKMLMKNLWINLLSMENFSQGSINIGEAMIILKLVNSTSLKSEKQFKNI